MTKRITANHIKLKRAYEPATADDGTRVLIDRLWPRGSNESNFNRPLKANYRMDWIGIFWLFPPTKRAWPLALLRGKVMNAAAPRLSALIGSSADLHPSIHTALSGLGGFEHAGVTVRDKQGAVEGVWSNVGLNLCFDFGVREHDMGRS